MNTPCAFARTLIVVAMIVAGPRVAGAQVKVIISGGFSATYRELIPEFEKVSGVTVATTSGGSIGSGPNTIGNQIRRGVTADVIILAREGLRELIAEGRIVDGSDVDLARSLIGMVVRGGAPKPDIRTVDGLKQALLRASSVAVSTSTSGVYLTTTLFPTLGIASQMSAKTTMNGAAAVGRGEAEVGLQQISEVLPLKGVDFVGPIPDEVQYVTTYAAAVVRGSAHIEEARRLIAYLAASSAFNAIRRSGMEPSRSAAGAGPPPRQR